MQRRKAVEVIGFYKMKAKALGLMLWPVTIGLGIYGWIKWKWYALPLAVIAVWILSNLYALYTAKRLERITGLGIHGQIVAYHESIAGRGHPLARDYKAYWAYSKSIPDEETSPGEETGGG